MTVFDSQPSCCTNIYFEIVLYPNTSFSHFQPLGDVSSVGIILALIVWLVLYVSSRYFLRKKLTDLDNIYFYEFVR